MTATSASADVHACSMVNTASEHSWGVAAQQASQPSSSFLKKEG